MKRKHSFLFLVLICAVSFCATFFVAGCGNETQTDTDTDTTQSPSDDTSSMKVHSEAEAISIATESEKVQDEIARDLGFQSYKISLGSTSAYILNGSSWFVTLKGSISGYIDDYNSKFASKKFEARVHIVAKTGEIYSVTTKQVV